MNSSILQRIHKLLALANSSNEHEARMAAEKAQELLVRHNLSAQQVGDLHRKQYIEEGQKLRVRMAPEEKYIVAIVSEYFFVRVLQGRSQTYSSSGRAVWGSRIILVGEKENTQIAGYVYDFLIRAFRDCFSKYRKETGAGLNARASFYHGMELGVRHALSRARERVQTSMALTLVPDKDLDDYAAKRSTGTKNIENGQINDPDAMRKGYEVGKDLRIRRGLDSGPEQTGRALSSGGPK